MRTMALLLLTALLVVTAVGCGEQTTEEAQAQLRSDLDAFKTALGEFGNLGVDSNIEDFQATREDVQQAWDAVVASAADVKDAKIDDLQSSWDDLKKAIDDINSDMTIPEAVNSISDEVAAVRDAWDQLYSTVAQ